jgi:copper(I)-binding protein
MRLVLALCGSLIGVTAIAADSVQIGLLEITRPWVRATPKGATVAGGYLQIRNNGTSADRLIGGSSNVAKRFELHSMTLDQGVMRMRQLKQGLELRPGETTELKPGGYHVMFVELAQPLEKGQRIKATLLFEKAGRVEIEFPVEAIGTSQPAGHGHHGGRH